jgi:Na+/melibiose symporter-like transporter
MKKHQYLTINFYWFGLSFLWNGLHPIILPALLLTFIPVSQKNSYLGIMTFIGLILAMFIQPISGSISDRTRSKFGSRRPWMFWGVLFVSIFLGLMSNSSTLLWLVVLYFLLQISSNIAHGPAQGLIPDLVPQEKRGLASGVKNLLEMSALVITSLTAGKLMSEDNPSRAFIIIAGVVLASAAITLFFTKEKKSDQDAQTEDFRLRDLIGFNAKENPEFIKLLISRLMILFGIYAVQRFAQYYIQDWLGLANPEEITGNLMAAIGGAITLVVFPAGFIADKIGPKRLNLMAGFLASFGIAGLIFTKTLAMLYVFGTVLGLATGIFFSVNWALAMKLIPKNQGGKYLGITNFATAGASALVGIGGLLVDKLNNLNPGTFLGYPIFFTVAALSSLIGTLVLRGIKVEK